LLLNKSTVRKRKKLSPSPSSDPTRTRKRRRTTINRTHADKSQAYIICTAHYDQFDDSSDHSESYSDHDTSELEQPQRAADADSDQRTVQAIGAEQKYTSLHSFPMLGPISHVRGYQWDCGNAECHKHGVDHYQSAALGDEYTLCAVCVQHHPANKLDIEAVARSRHSHGDAYDVDADWDVEHILKHRTITGCEEKEYFVKWTYWPASTNSWVHESELVSCAERIDAYWARRERDAAKRKRGSTKSKSRPSSRLHQRTVLPETTVLFICLVFVCLRLYCHVQMASTYAVPSITGLKATCIACGSRCRCDVD
jgi:hypothetical protein